MKIHSAITIAALSLSMLTTVQFCSAQRGSAGYSPQLNSGNRALAVKKWNSAASHFRAALEWDRNGVDAHIGLGNVYLATGKPKRAAEEFSAALRLRPHSAAAERGIHLARSTDEEATSFTELEAQVKQEPGNPDLRATYAEELVERNRFEEAQKEAEEALRLDPKQGHAYCALGRIATKQGNDAEARKNLEIAIKRDSMDDDALTALGDLAMKAKDYRQAASYYRRVAHILPDEKEGHEKLLVALEGLGDARGAEREKATIARLSQPKS